jgi:hypothetical protein
MAYQTLLVVLSVLVGLVLRDRWKHRSSYAAVAVGLVAMVAVQVVLDKLVYGEWGGSVSRYTIANVGGTATGWLLKLGLRKAAEALYSWQSSIGDFEVDLSAPGTRQLYPPTWYLDHFQEMFVAPVIAFWLIGAWRAARERIGALAFLFAVFALNLAVMSFKGEKSYRLWLPLLATVLPTAGLGFAWLASSEGWRALKRTFAWATLGAAAVLGFGALRDQPLALHGVYWDAIDHANAELEAHPPPEGHRVKLNAAYLWAVFLRNAKAIELVRLNHPLESFGKLKPEERRGVEGELDRLDALIVHLPVLTRPDESAASSGELFRAVNSRFRVHSAFYDQRSPAARLGPVYVLERQRSDARARRFFELESVGDPERYAEIHKFNRPIDFVRDAPEGREVLTLLGFEVEAIPGSQHQWITYHW